MDGSFDLYQTRSDRRRFRHDRVKEKRGESAEFSWRGFLFFSTLTDRYNRNGAHLANTG